MTNRKEFGACMAILTAAFQKELPKETLAVYYELLKHFPAQALRIAAERTCLEYKFLAFPPVAVIAEFAQAAQFGSVKPLSGTEAWGLAMDAIDRIDIDSQGSKERHLAKLPALVLKAVQDFGFMSLYNLPNSQIETCRAQFARSYDALAERAAKTGLLPPPVQEELRQISNERSKGRQIAHELAKKLPGVG